MAFFVLVLMLLMPCIIGNGALHILYGKGEEGTALTKGLLPGIMISLGLAGAAHLTACLLGQSFSDSAMLWGGAETALCLAAAVMLYGKRKKKAVPGFRPKREQLKGRERWLFFLLLLVIGVQLLSAALPTELYIKGDMTLETVNSFLTGDRVYLLNPLTGREYTAGLPLRLRLLALPSMYGFICKCFSLEAEVVVLQLVPVVVLLGSYAAYNMLGKCLFGENIKKRTVFLLCVAFLYTAGDYMLGMDGFNVLHCGFRGVTIRGAVILPYTFALLLQKRYRLLPLCILAELCIVWTLYGMGSCLLVCICWLGLERLLGVAGKYKRKK